MHLYALVNDFPQLALAHLEVYFKLGGIVGIRAVDKAQILRYMLVKDYLSYRGIYKLRHWNIVHHTGRARFYGGMNCYNALLIRHQSLVEVAVYASFSRLSLFGYGKVVGA